mmetsp:Transcript_534/g.810  ORF Transcript_534/g.810 Transcript_534/m.810 type:complete len:87 (+) Transcript_534:263-523(+)
MILSKVNAERFLALLFLFYLYTYLLRHRLCKCDEYETFSLPLRDEIEGRNLQNARQTEYELPASRDQLGYLCIYICTGSQWYEVDA